MSSSLRNRSHRLGVALLASAVSAGVVIASAVPTAATVPARAQTATVSLRALDGAGTPLDFQAKYVDSYGYRRELGCSNGGSTEDFCTTVQLDPGTQTIKVIPGRFTDFAEDDAKTVTVDPAPGEDLQVTVNFPAEIIQTARPEVDVTSFNGLWVVRGEPVYGQLGSYAQRFVYDEATVQWLRDGEEIAGATQKQYTPTKADKGHQLSFRNDVDKAGYPPFTSVSKEHVVSLHRSTSRLKFSRHKVQRGEAHRVRIKARAEVSDGRNPHGKFLLRYLDHDPDDPTWRTYRTHRVDDTDAVHFRIANSFHRSTRWHTMFVPDHPRNVAGGPSNDQVLRIVR